MSMFSVLHCDKYFLQKENFKKADCKAHNIISKFIHNFSCFEKYRTVSVFNGDVSDTEPVLGTRSRLTLRTGKDSLFLFLFYIWSSVVILGKLYLLILWIGSPETFRYRCKCNLCQCRSIIDHVLTIKFESCHCQCQRINNYAVIFSTSNFIL